MANTPPSIAIHPMIIFGFSLMVGFGLGRVWPLPYPILPGSTYVGYGMAALGAVLLLSASREFSRHKTSDSCKVCATTLITSGPYRFFRNPVYVGLTLMLIGYAVKSNNIWLVILVPALLAAVTSYVILKEEAHLEREFGDHYRTYKGAVRRWL